MDRTFAERISLAIAAGYLVLAGMFAWLFYVRYWKWRECIEAAMSSCITPDGDNLIGGGRFWLLFSLGFAVASVRRAVRWHKAQQRVAADRAKTRDG